MKHLFLLALALISFDASAREQTFSMNIRTEASVVAEYDHHNIVINYEEKGEDAKLVQKKLAESIYNAEKFFRNNKIEYKLQDFKLESKEGNFSSRSATVFFTSKNKDKLEEFAKNQKFKEIEIKKSGNFYSFSKKLSASNKNYRAVDHELNEQISVLRRNSSLAKIESSKRMHDSLNTKKKIHTAKRSIILILTDRKKLKEVKDKFAGHIVKIKEYSSDETLDKYKEEILKKAYDKAIKEAEYIQKISDRDSYEIRSLNYEFSNNVPKNRGSYNNRGYNSNKPDSLDYLTVKVNLSIIMIKNRN